MTLPAYQEHEIFTIPWGSVYEYDSEPSHAPVEQPPVKYVVLSLDKVKLTYRIQPVPNGYRIRCKQGQEAPWTLGICQSLEEAKFRVYDCILYFGLYVDGTWQGLRTHRLLSPAQKAAQWSLEGKV